MSGELRMQVLDVMMDDIEDMASIMRSLSAGFAVSVTDGVLVETLRMLLEEDLIEAYGEVLGSAELHWVERPDITPAAIRRYWFCPTRAGRELWAMWPGPEWDSPDTP